MEKNYGLTGNLKGKEVIVANDLQATDKGLKAFKEKVGKKGVVREPQTHREVLQMAQEYAMANHFTCAGLDFSPIKGPEGNIEFLLFVRHDQAPKPLPDGLIEQTVAAAHETLDKAPNLH